ncbi:universal stress protein [Litoribacter alkaliphilus]|uniref:Universal stress protein n=1 Tax=Litoribacter ruber TaxID=702568 RepID=A0AAP2CJS1_9BACT|nr:universal stress protein [Litoribacter alkaliphilus]MBS9525993.1 universal stress protein [Litoribacter alkaliphilus]
MKILVPTDLSENADVALEFAKGLVMKTGGEIMLLFSYYAVYDFAAQATQIIHQIEKDAKKYLKKAIKEKNTEGLKMDYLIVQGTVSTAINTAAREMKSDLIVMGTQGASGIKKVLLGSNTADVIKETKTPVLAIPNSARFDRLKDITVAVELKKEDPKAIEKLIELTSPLGLPYEVLHIDKGGNFDTEISFKGFKSHLTETFPHLHFDYFNQKDENFNKGLEKFLNDHPDTLLVMFSKSRSFFEQLFSKSHTVETAYHTHVPLMVIKS